MRLKSRTEFPPGGFQLLLPEVGMTKSLSGSFREMVEAFAMIVQKNPALAQRLGWPTQRAAQEAFVEERECRRLVSQGWSQFVDLSGPNYVPLPEVKKKGLAAVAGGAKAARSAIMAYTAMFSKTGPVANDVAIARASVCVDCPKNDTQNSLKNLFVETAAKEIMALLGALKDMTLTTPYDEKLGICTACHCPMRAKIHAPIEAIRAGMPQEVWQEIQTVPNCWIKTALQAGGAN
jgi:hypothetical protein